MATPTPDDILDNAVRRAVLPDAYVTGPTKLYLIFTPEMGEYPVKGQIQGEEIYAWGMNVDAVEDELKERWRRYNRRPIPERQVKVVEW